MGRRTKNLIVLFFFFLVSIPLVWSFFTPGYFQTHDGDFFLMRLIEFDKVFRAGQIPPRWAPDLNHGYGLPVFNFFYPGYLYIGELFRLLNFSYTGSLKTIFVLSFPFSAFGMYLFVNKIMGKLAGIISGLFYLYAPYRLLDVYVRGQIGEILALTIAPYLFWVILSLSSDKYRRSLLLIGTFLVGLFFISHNITTMVFSLVIFGYLIFLFFQNRAKNLFRKYVILFLCGFCFSAFFVLPALLEKQNVILGQHIAVDYQGQFPTIKQLIYSPWGYGYSQIGTNDGISFQLGVAHLLSLLITIICLGITMVKSLKKIDFTSKNLLFFMGITLISIFFTLEISKPIWKIVPYLSQVQFPWRLNVLTIFSLSVLAGGLTLSKVKYLLPILLILLFMNVRNYSRPGYFERYTDKDYFNNYLLYRGTGSLTDEVVPMWVEKKPSNESKEKISILSGQAKLTDLTDKGISQKGKIEVISDKAVLETNTTYYPGWEVKIDNRQVVTRIGRPYGTILSEVPQGNHEIKVEFKETSLRIFSNLLFCAGLIMLTVALIVLK